MSNRNLNYDPNSLIALPSREEVADFEEYLRFYFEDDTIKFPESLVYQFLNFHGGIPGKQCFDQPDGIKRMICRFCNILRVDEKLLPGPKIETWRNRNFDARLDYSIDGFFDYFDYQGRLSESTGTLVPIAALDTAGGYNARGQDEMDLLCLDYDKGKEPSVVTWCFESSWANPEDTIKVADSFDEFLEMLYERPDDFHVESDCDNF